jgi:hypothetical protein
METLMAAIRINRSTKRFLKRKREEAAAKKVPEIE